MTGYKDNSDVAKKADEVVQNNNWPMMSSMVSVVHNGSEVITTMLGHSFKTKSTKSRATFLS